MTISKHSQKHKVSSAMAFAAADIQRMCVGYMPRICHRDANSFRESPTRVGKAGTLGNYAWNHAGNHGMSNRENAAALAAHGGQCVVFMGAASRTANPGQGTRGLGMSGPGVSHLWCFTCMPEESWC